MAEKTNVCLDALLETLKKMNCDMEKDQEVENRYQFKFQGEHFILDYSPESCIFMLYDIGWAECLLEDIDEVAVFRKAINAANRFSGASVWFTIDDPGAECKFHVHASCEFPFMPELPDKESYMGYTLGKCFRAHKHFSESLYKFRSEYQKNKEE